MSAGSGRGPKRVTVTIKHNEGNTPSVDCDAVEIWAPLGDEVEWVCDPPEKLFYVSFDGESPFEGHHFHNQNNRSGSVRAKASGRYKYSVDIDGRILDPTVIVHPP